MATKRNWIPACYLQRARFVSQFFGSLRAGDKCPSASAGFRIFLLLWVPHLQCFQRHSHWSHGSLTHSWRLSFAIFCSWRTVTNGRSDAILLEMWWSGQSGQFSPTEDNRPYLKINNRLKTNKTLILLQTYGRCDWNCCELEIPMLRV